ncbi:N-alpha-acetyltransferase 15/16, NatA auxiliary subunit, partial [Lecanoromycetidae sp. Uapishka_2]
MAPQPQPLGSKERSLFSQVVKNYENKQYKKGIKAADQILRKFPDHGDTIAMKALIINSQGHTEEAFALAKVALKNSMKSHVCWHVYGLLYRSAKNFEEAIKAYKFALKLEPESQQIQKDLALLQMQMRDYPGYVQSRTAILRQRTSFRQNWTALAIAQHLAGNLEEAERTLTTYEETLKVVPPKTDIEHAEAVLYKNSIIAEMGETERALDHLDAAAKNNPDRTSVMELRARYLLVLKRNEDAAKAYRALLERNPEYRVYYEGLQSALGFSNEDVESLKDLYDEYANKNPRGDAARRIPLDFLEGNDFRKAVDQYLQHMLHKGVPSTFANVKALYPDSRKKDTIQELVEGYAAGKDTPQPNGSAEMQANGDSEKPDLFAPSVRYFLAQHYNYHLSRDLTKAMKYIDEAIESSPESVDYHMAKARILKHQGSARKAAEMMEKARTLDTRDRYINTKAAKYHLRNNDNEAAIENMTINAARIYVRLYDDPNLAHGLLSNGVNGEKMDSAERKKAEKKARKEKEKQEKAEAEKKDAKKPAAVDQNGEPKKEDKDPKGDQLLQTSEPLVEAMKFINPLLEFSPRNIEAQQVGFEVFFRRRKFLLALRSLIASHDISPSNPTTHEQLFRFQRAISKLSEHLEPKAMEVINAEFNTILPASTDLTKHNDEFMQKYHDSPAHVQAALRVRQLLDLSISEKNQQDVIRMLALEGSTLEDAVQGLEMLKGWKAKEQYVNDYIAAAHERWPEASAFEEKEG